MPDQPRWLATHLQPLVVAIRALREERWQRERELVALAVARFVAWVADQPAPAANAAQGRGRLRTYLSDENREASIAAAARAWACTRRDVVLAFYGATTASRERGLWTADDEGRGAYPIAYEMADRLRAGRRGFPSGKRLRDLEARSSREARAFWNASGVVWLGASEMQERRERADNRSTNGERDPMGKTIQINLRVSDAMHQRAERYLTEYRKLPGQDDAVLADALRALIDLGLRAANIDADVAPKKGKR